MSKADIHIHTNYSDGLHEPEAIINYAVTQTDLQVIAVTDHNTIDGARCAYDYWQRHRAEFGRLEVIKGIEVTSSKGHILALFVEEDIPAHMSPADTVKAIHAQGGLAVAAHPFTHLLYFADLHGIGREIGELPLDAVEIRNSVPVELYTNWITAIYNRRHRNHPALGGSDTHYLTMMGKTYTEFAGQTAQDFRQSLQHKKVKPGGYVNGPRLALQVMLHLIHRRRLPVFLPNDRHYRHTSAGLTVEVEEMRHTSGAILHCAGQLVSANANLLKAEATRLLDGNITRLIMDLAQVTFLDSAGLGAIVAAHKRAHTVGGAVTLCAPTQNVAMTLRLVRLDKVFSIYSTLRQALAALPGIN
jgi:anti-anti-sigma factor